MLLLLPVLLMQAPAPSVTPFTPLAFLVGAWEGVGSGAPGEATGTFSFQPDLEGKAMVRRNRADYPAQQGRPAFRHEDLMVVRVEDGTLKALYVDNEGHSIPYAVQASEGRAVFLSETRAGHPRFRLTYLRESDGSLAIAFEVAPPDKPEAFATYIRAKARRK